jgi:hypothetical protein
MSDKLEIPEGLTKHERQELKREFYKDQEIKSNSLSKVKTYGALVFVFALLIIGAYVFISQVTAPKPGQFVTSLGNKHLKEINEPHEAYNSLPPSSGSHMGSKAQWGISSEPIPDEIQLHNLEDGGVMVQYNCPTQEVECNKLISDLTAIVQKYSDKVVLAPYPKMDTKIALTAWTRIDKFNEFDPDRIQKFIKAFRGIDNH